MGNSSSNYQYPSVNDYVDRRDEIPESAWVAFVHLIEMRDLDGVLANDFGGKADPYVTICLSKVTSSADPFGGRQKQRSSMKAATIHPTWQPRES